jgi:hypothetical protein
MNLHTISLGNFSKLFAALICFTILSNKILQLTINKYSIYTFSNGGNEKIDFQNKTHLFKTTIQLDCDSKKLELNQSCLLKLEKFDTYLLNPKRKHFMPDDACEKCFTSTKNSKVYYHTFWHYDQFDINNGIHVNRFRMINLNLMSYLATQNLCCTRFILWKLTNFPLQLENWIKEVFYYYIDMTIIEIRTFTVEEFCESGFFKTKICTNKPNYPSLSGRYLVALSDMVRFAVLDKYPGIYTDGDTIYLKDMRFLWYINFAYRWSYLSTYNTAVMGFNKYINPSISELLNSINTESSSIDSLISSFHPDSITRYVNKLNTFSKTIFDYDPLLALHSHFFDGAWLCNDLAMKRAKTSDVCRFQEFAVFNNLTKHFEIGDFFKGAYACHIHYISMGEKIVTDSYFFHFERYFLNFIDNLNISFYKKYQINARTKKIF